MAIAYLVQDGYWSSLPSNVQKQVFAGFHSVYSFGGKSDYMKLQGVGVNNVPQEINLTDAVIQLHDDSGTAKSALVDRIVHQMVQIPDFHIPLPKYLSETLQVGRGFTYKIVLRSGKVGAIIPVCITEAVVSVNGALGWWHWKTREARRDKLEQVIGDLKTLSAKLGLNAAWLREKATPEWQKWFGLCLGRMVAHEVWHQIWSQDKTINTSGKDLYGIPHPEKSYYLEEDGGGTYWTDRDPTQGGFGAAGRDWICDTLPRLKSLQGNHKALSIRRRAPYH